MHWPVLVCKLFIFLAVLGLHCCAWAFSSCGKQGLFFIAMYRLLIVVASPAVEHQLWRAQASVASAHQP